MSFQNSNNGQVEPIIVLLATTPWALTNAFINTLDGWLVDAGPSSKEGELGG